MKKKTLEVLNNSNTEQQQYWTTATLNNSNTGEFRKMFSAVGKTLVQVFRVKVKYFEGD